MICMQEVALKFITLEARTGGPLLIDPDTIWSVAPDEGGACLFIRDGVGRLPGGVAVAYVKTRSTVAEVVDALDRAGGEIDPRIGPRSPRRHGRARSIGERLDAAMKAVGPKPATLDDREGAAEMLIARLMDALPPEGDLYEMAFADFPELLAAAASRAVAARKRAWSADGRVTMAQWEMRALASQAAEGEE